jgi:hypothetical protein
MTVHTARRCESVASTRRNPKMLATSLHIAILKAASARTLFEAATHFAMK